MKKKKILIIPSWYPNNENPGLGTFFREQAALFEDEFDVRIFTGHLNTDISRVKKIKNTVRFTLLKKVRTQKKDDYFLAPPRVYSFSYTQGLNKYKNANYSLSIKAYLDYFESYILSNWKPDLIHAHDTFIGGIMAHSIYKKWSIPYIITEHNYLLFDQPDYIQNDFITALKSANNILLVSEYQKRILRYRNLVEDIHVVGNYIDEKLYVPAEKVDKKNVFKILFVGRFAHHKDYNTLVKTIMLFSEFIKSKNYCFQIIGTGKEGETYLKDYVETSVYRDHCKVYSYISRDEIPAYFKNCDILLNTSIAETFGVVTGEAMMCGKPVVSTNSGGFDEMYVPGVNGIKCAIGDAEGLAKSLLSVYNQEVVFEPVKIRESVLKKFGSEAFKAKISRFYG